MGPAGDQEEKKTPGRIDNTRALFEVINREEKQEGRKLRQSWYRGGANRGSIRETDAAG